MIKPLLVVAIPTYNRPKELKGNLENCLKEFNNLNQSQKEMVTFFISDNGSTNYDLKELIKDYINHIPIKYFIQKENIGPTKNFEYCYRNLDSKYLLLLSDDDYFTNDSLSFVINLIVKKKPGVMFLNSYEKFNNLSKLDIEIIEDKNEFIKKLDVLPTLISSIVFNKKLLNAIEPKFLDTNLHQLYYYFCSVILADKLIIVNKRILLSPYSNNSGGYNWFHTFCNELYNIIDSIIEKNVLDRNILNNMKKKILRQRLIPNFLNYKIEEHKFSKFNNSSVYEVFKLIFFRNKSFLFTWILLLPLFLLPKRLIASLKKIYLSIKGD